MARALERYTEHLEWRSGADLQAFARQELGDGKRKSLRLFHGVIGYRTKPAGVCVTDPAAALAWARENLPEAVVEGLDRKALADRLLDTGEALPFAALIPAAETFDLGARPGPAAVRRWRLLRRRRVRSQACP